MARSLNSVESLSQFSSDTTFSRGRIYTIKKGDTLSQIAKLEYGNSNLWPYIWVNNLNYCSANKVGILSPLLLTLGKQIFLPLKNHVLKWYSKEDVNELYFVTRLEQIMPLYLKRSTIEPNRFPDKNKCYPIFNVKVSEKNSIALPEYSPSISLDNKDIFPSQTINLEGRSIEQSKLVSAKYGEFGVKIGFNKGKFTYKPSRDMPILYDTAVSTKGKIKEAYSNKELNIKIGEFILKSFEVNYEFSNQLIIEFKFNDTTLAIGSANGISIKQEVEVSKVEQKSQTDDKKIISGASFKWEYAIEGRSIVISAKASIHMKLISHLYKKGDRLDYLIFKEDCEYSYCLEDVEAFFGCIITPKNLKHLKWIKDLLDKLKSGKKILDKSERAAKLLLKMFMLLWNKIMKNKGGKLPPDSPIESNQNAEKKSPKKERRRDRVKREKKERKASQAQKKTKQAEKKSKKKNIKHSFSDLLDLENIDIDFSDDKIELIPPNSSSERFPILTHIDYEYSKNFTKLLRRMDYMNSAQNWDVKKLRRAINSYEEEQIKNDIIKNRGIPYSFRFLDAFAAHGAANNKEFPERGELFFSLDPKTGLQNLSTYLLIGGLIVVGAVLIVYTLPVTIPVAVATGSAIAAGVGKAAAVGKLAITVTGTYAIAFK